MAQLLDKVIIHNKGHTTGKKYVQMHPLVSKTVENNYVQFLFLFTDISIQVMPYWVHLCVSLWFCLQ